MKPFIKIGDQYFSTAHIVSVKDAGDYVSLTMSHSLDDQGRTIRNLSGEAADALRNWVDAISSKPAAKPISGGNIL